MEIRIGQVNVGLKAFDPVIFHLLAVGIHGADEDR
jgi:hypothetical protein